MISTTAPPVLPAIETLSKTSSTPERAVTLARGTIVRQRLGQYGSGAVDNSRIRDYARVRQKDHVRAGDPVATVREDLGGGRHARCSEPGPIEFLDLDLIGRCVRLADYSQAGQRDRRDSEYVFRSHRQPPYQRLRALSVPLATARRSRLLCKATEVPEAADRKIAGLAIPGAGVKAGGENPP